MKKLFLIILLFFLFSCKKENKTISSTLTSNPYLEKAKEFNKNNISDSAFYYFNLAKDAFLNNHDSLGAARSLVNMAIIQTNRGDFFGGIETSLEANKFIKHSNDTIVMRTLAANYNNMGIAANYLKMSDRAIVYYKQAIINAIDEENKYVYYNNIGDVLLTRGELKHAKQYLEKAILVKDKKNYSKALNNLAKAKYLDDRNYDPLPDLYKALQIRENEKDGSGQNSSFETLSTYYLNRDKNLSLHFANKMFQTATENKSTADQILALKRIIYLDAKNYLKNFQKFNLLNDALQTARNKDKNQFAVVRYDLEGKNAENQRLKADKARNYSLFIQQSVILFVVVLALIIIVVWYQKRQKRLKQENELKIKVNQLKISKKVHDVVANGIYQVMTKIENQEGFSKDQALDELEFVYEKSRDISYDKENATEEEDFSEKISLSIGSFNNDTVKTYIAGNEKNIWEYVSQPKQEEIYQIIRELLVNMKKHSQASIVSFRFEKNNNEITIHYKDNGIGMSGAVMHKNGLTNMVSRIEILKGQIIFDPETEKGLKIDISFPVY